MLSDNEAITDENLLATTVIPRFIEEVEGMFPEFSKVSLASFLHMD